jgi:hypothetical protein
LSELRKRYPHQLSGGQQQRVARGAPPRRPPPGARARRQPRCRAPGRAVWRPRRLVADGAAPRCRQDPD